MASPMDVVFSFDTTGSMSQVLDEVKGRVNDLVQRLQADIPEFHVGVIAHGDYCDRDEFYDIRSLRLTNSLPDVVDFLSETTGTGGGDIPECYELALEHARFMPWRTGSRRVLVVIGDAYPHEKMYPLNAMRIDWQEELSDLVKQNVRVYSVQYGEDPQSSAFFQRLAHQSGGQHLRLQDMGDICHIIMGICYREQGADLFQTYQAEIRTEDTTGTLASGLENAFAELGKTQQVETGELEKSSSAGDRVDDTPIPTPLPPLSVVCPDLSREISEVCSSHRQSTDQDDSTETSGSCPPSPTNTEILFGSDSESDDEDYVPPTTNGKLDECKSSKQTAKKRARSGDFMEETRSPAKKAKLDGRADTLVLADPPSCAALLNVGAVKGSRKSSARSSKISSSRHAKTKGRKVTTSSRQRRITTTQALPKSKRENVSCGHFRFNSLPWSRWHLAASTETLGIPGVWRKIGQRRCDNTLWRTDLLRLCAAKIERELIAAGAKTRSGKIIADVSRGAVFELGVMSPQTREIKVTWFHATNQRKNRHTAIPRLLSRPWYSGLAREIKAPLTATTKAGSRVYLRWAVLDDVPAVKRDVLSQYDYLWRS